VTLPYQGCQEPGVDSAQSTGLTGTGLLIPKVAALKQPKQAHFCILGFNEV
jgi:hypothetical protein